MFNGITIAIAIAVLIMGIYVFYIWQTSKKYGKKGQGNVKNKN